MNIITKTIDYESVLHLGDIVELEHRNTARSLYVVTPWRGVKDESEYVLLNLNSGAFVNTNSRTFNGSYKTLSDLTLSVKNKIIERYPRSEYELLLQKKKKC
ncbi:hypothetical protein [Metaclostridioides mangenotii]|uniref:hypothetical protein n=1 Tax=Metaclostridioides mangenotii TaxID=1540 RepID=UPI0028E60477|nr:hypothetical protein [Clostridioides mangenotii]